MLNIEIVVIMALNQLHLEDNFIRYGHYSPLMDYSDGDKYSPRNISETTIWCNLKKGRYIVCPRINGHNLSNINPEYTAAKSSKTTKRYR